MLGVESGAQAAHWSSAAQPSWCSSPIATPPTHRPLFYFSGGKCFQVFPFFFFCSSYFSMYKISFTLLDCKYRVSTLSYRVYKHFKKIIKHFVKWLDTFLSCAFHSNGSRRLWPRSRIRDWLPRAHPVFWERERLATSSSNGWCTSHRRHCSAYAHCRARCSAPVGRESEFQTLGEP